MNTESATVPHVISFFCYENNNYKENSWVSSGTQEISIEAEITTPGWYFVFIRSQDSNYKGTVNFHISHGTGGATDYYNIPITCSRLLMTQEIDLNKYYATFLTGCELSWPFMTIENSVNFPSKVLDYNGLYNNGGMNLIVNKYSIAPKVVYVSGGTSANPNQIYHGDLYACVERGVVPPSSTPWLDAYVSSIGEKDGYNCFAWVGGVITERWDPIWNAIYSPHLEPYGGDLSNYLGNVDKYGNTLLRYQGATTYSLMVDANGNMRLDPNSDEVAIDLYWGELLSNPNRANHAAIRRGADANPHGFESESKMGSDGDRIFHRKLGSPVTDPGMYNTIGGHYKRAAIQKSAVEMSMYESLAQGLSVIENPQITEAEKAVLTGMKAVVSPTVKAQFETQAAVLSSVLKQREANPAMRKISLSDITPYATVKNLYVQNKEAVLPLIMDAYVQNKYDNIVLLETMIAENEEYQALAEEILKRNRENQYTPDGAYIVRSAYSNGMLFVKELLKRQSDFSLKKRTQSTQKDIKYSNSDPFEVFYKDGTLSVEFFTEEASEISISIY